MQDNFWHQLRKSGKGRRRREKGGYASPYRTHRPSYGGGIRYKLCKDDCALVSRSYHVRPPLEYFKIVNAHAHAFLIPSPYRCRRLHFYHPITIISSQTSLSPSLSSFELHRKDAIRSTKKNGREAHYTSYLFLLWSGRLHV